MVSQAALAAAERARATESAAAKSNADIASASLSPKTLEKITSIAKTKVNSPKHFSSLGNGPYAEMVRKRMRCI